MSSAYDVINNRILKAMKKGVVPWQQPWDSGASSLAPVSASTKKPYRGTNHFMLGMIQRELGYNSNIWGTKNVWTKRLGGAIKPEELGKFEYVVFYRFIALYDQENGEDEDKKVTGSIPILRYYRVYNGTQIEGIDSVPGLGPIIQEPPEPKEPDRMLEDAQRIFSAYIAREKVGLDLNSPHAVYYPDHDRIGLPPSETFISPEFFYGTAFHEAAHSTGAKSRLDRTLVGNMGAESYSKEELIAETTAAFVLGTINMDYLQVTQTNMAAYLRAWTKQLKDNNKLFISASGAAQKAADLILGVKSTPEEHHED